MNAATGTPNPKGFFVFNEKMIRHILAFNSILWVQASRSYTVIHLKEKDFVVCSKNIKKIEAQFFRAGFVRVHRSHMVNLNEVVTFEGRRVLLSDDTFLVVAHREVNDFLRAYCENKNLPLRRRSRYVRSVG